jgi:O-antigen ligase
MHLVKNVFVDLIVKSLFGASFWAFFILNLPSLKILYFDELLNLVPLIGLYIIPIFLTKKEFRLTKTQIYFLIWFSLFILLLLLSGIMSQNSVLTSKLLFRYIYVYFTVIGLVFFVREIHLTGILFWQIIWGTTLSIVKIFYGLSVSFHDNAIHYNTLSMPMACSFMATSGLLFFVNQSNSFKLYSKILLWFCLIVNLLALTSQPGRGPVIFSLLTIFLVILAKRLLINSNELKNKNKSVLFINNQWIKIIFILPILGYIAFQNIQTQLSEVWLNRYYNLFTNTQNESRNDLWLPALEAIVENPLGYGLNSSEYIIGFYPHNIFLETLISSGIFGVIPLLIILFIFFQKLVTIIKKETLYIPISMMSLMILFMWNVSFDLGASYLPFGAIAISLSSLNTKKIISK